jgi:hypothetical protein
MHSKIILDFSYFSTFSKMIIIFSDMVTFLGQELSANAKIDMDKDKDKIEKVELHD